MAVLTTVQSHPSPYCPNRTGGARSGVPRRASSIDARLFQQTFEGIAGNVESVIKGKQEVVRLALVAILCEGHILFEDVPGTGKSMLARAVSQTIKATANRVQCTPDMLPGDITGSSIYDQNRGVFEFRPGPVFAHILLADEVNRPTPKTQSALLEAMAERTVSIDGVTHPLPRPFLVLATQNPVELAGTFPLPEAQLDRFLFKLTMGYLDREREFEVMFDNSRALSVESLGHVVDTTVVQRMIDYAATVEVAPEVGYYIVDLVQASRHDAAVAMGTRTAAPSFSGMRSSSTKVDTPRRERRVTSTSRRSPSRARGNRPVRSPRSPRRRGAVTRASTTKATAP